MPNVLLRLETLDQIAALLLQLFATPVLQSTLRNQLHNAVLREIYAGLVEGDRNVKDTVHQKFRIIAVRLNNLIARSAYAATLSNHLLADYLDLEQHLKLHVGGSCLHHMN